MESATTFQSDNSIVNAPAKDKKPKSKIIFIIITIISLFILLILGTMTFAILSSGAVPKNPVSNSSTQIPTPAVLALVFSGANDGDVVTVSSLKLTGDTGANAQVTITGGSEDMLVESTGNFSATVPLKIGVNQLTITATDSQGNQKTRSLSVFYQGSG